MFFLSFLVLFVSGALIIETAGFPTIPYGFGTARQVLIIGVDGLGKATVPHTLAWTLIDTLNHH